MINQENQGLSVARNKGIAASKGEYLLMPDSDDLLIENSLPFLLEQALSSRADLVVADFLKMSDKEIDNLMTFAIEQKGTKIAEKTGEKLYLEDFKKLGIIYEEKLVPLILTLACCRKYDYYK